MSGKEKTGVVHRPNRGRSAPDSKSKTDSGCFVDDEIERNGSSDSSHGSISSPPVKEKAPKKCKAANKESLANTDTASSVSIGTETNCASSHVAGKENVMNGEVITNGENETLVTESVNGVCDVLEKTRRASDFYCLYYSESPEGTLTTSEVVKLRRKPPVPPKPKLRRGSAPPSSFNHIDRLVTENKDLTKRFSYNESLGEYKVVNGEHEEGQEHAKLNSVESRVHFFEAIARDGSIGGTVLKNVQTTSVKDSSYVCGSKDFSLESCSDSHPVLSCHDQVENIVPPADNETFSLESDKDYSESFHAHVEAVHSPQQFVPLVEEEEFAIDGSSCFQSSVSSSLASEKFYDSSIENEKARLECVSEDEEVDIQGKFVPDVGQDGDNVAAHEINHSFLATAASIPEQNVMESCKARGSGLLTTKASGNDVQFSDSFLPLHDFVQIEQPRTGSCEKLLNPQVNELKQKLVIRSRSCDRMKAQRRPGSVAGLPNWEKGYTTSELKRRSWSFSEPSPVDVDSPFVRRIYQVPAPKLTTSSWCSESGLSYPFVNSVQEPLQSTSTRRNILRGKFGEGDCYTASASNLEYSGYTSDESSVHSEPLFQPLKCRPQDLRRGHIPKSMSLDSSICLTDNESSTFPRVQRRRARHSLGSQDPINALKRQSVEFATNEQPPLFRPVSPAQVPHLETLRRASSYTSSSSDSEVEKIFKPPNFCTQGYQYPTNGTVHNGLVNAVTHCKVSAMEALFGPQSLRNGHSSDSEVFRRKTLSERFSEVSQTPPSEGMFISEQLQEEELGGLKEGGEPGLEFDDTDYSEFYTRCEDKDSLISAEALSIKKLLQSPQTVLPDPDIESVVLSVTERKSSKSTSENKEPHEIQTGLCENDTACVNGTVSEHETVEQFYRRHRGTQTPPPAVFKALNPPPSVATQTPPVNFQQELPSSLLKELELQIKTPTIKRVSPTPSESQEQNLSLLGQFQSIGSSSAGVSNTEMLSPPPQESDKAVSVEELLQILAGMQVGTPKETVPRRPVSVQNYSCPSPQNDNTSERPNKAPKSLPSSWQHLSRPTGKQNDNDGFKKPDRIPPRSSKSYDCLRRGHSARERRANVITEKTLRRSESSENIRKSLREWKLRARVFEEEVECLENRDDQFKKLKCKEEKVLKVSFNGSESTDSIETQSKLTNTHSLKRPRKDRAFSQKEKNQADSSSLDAKQSLSAQNTKQDKVTGMEAELSDIDVKESNSDHGGDSGILEVASPAEGFQNRNQGTLCHEVASPEGIDVFIDYRKKHGMHITSTPKPTPNSEQKGEVGGKINFDELDDAQPEKPVITTTKEDKHAISDVESQGDASSSSYSSDDDRFGEFGGSTETVVFVDTEPCPGMSLVGTDLETLDLDLVGPSDKLLSVNDNNKEKDESHLDALLGEARRSLNLEFMDSDILDKAIDRFKKRVSPSTQNKALSGGLSMEAYVALHQADELQGIISEIKGELKLLHDENDMLRKEVVSLANQQTSGEATENSSTESSERLESICRLYRPRQVDTDDEEPVEIDVCLRGFSAAPVGHISSKKKDIRLGTVIVNGADWNGVMEAARKTFVDHMKKIDPENYLCLGAHSIQGVQTGVVVWSPGSLRRSSPRVELSNKNSPCVIELKDGSHFSCDSLVYDILLPKEIIENYVEQLLEHRCIVLCGQQGLGKSYLAAKLAEHVVQRIGWKTSPAVVTFNVTQTTRKELKQGLAPLMEVDISGSNKDRPAVIILDQLNCLASLADIFDFSQLEKNSNCPYIIGVRDKSRKGPFSSKELSLCHYFRWLRVSVNDRQYSGVLSRFLKRKLSWSELETNVESDDLLELFDWLSKVWYHLNEILVDFCDSDATLGPSLFYSCPMDFKVAEGWFVNVWNYNVIPYLHQTLRSGRKIFDRCVSWEDPTKWVVLRYPWNKDHSRVFHTLRKLRQVDVVLNRNQLGSDSVTFAECIEDNEKILRAHTSVSKRVRTVVQEKIPKGDLKTKRRTTERRDSHGEDCDRESSYSESDSYMETSI